MLILTHVIIALSSLVFTSVLFISPSRLKFYINYSLIALTIVSGTYLVVSAHTAMLSACETGLVYLGAVTIGSIFAYRRFAKITVRRDQKDI